MARPTIVVCWLLVLVAACPSSARRLHGIADALAAAGTTNPAMSAATGTNAIPHGAGLPGVKPTYGAGSSLGSNTLLSALASRQGFMNAHESIPAIADTLTHLVAATSSSSSSAATEVPPFASSGIGGSALGSTTGAVEGGGVTKPQLSTRTSLPAAAAVGGSALTQALTQLLTGTSTNPTNPASTTGLATAALHTPEPLPTHGLSQAPLTFQLSDR